MKSLFHYLLITVVSAQAARAESDSAAAEPWTEAREFAAFQFLLERSPFSLPTAEESSPVADRFALTGAVAIDGEPLVFVLDKTTQTRQMVSKKANDNNVSLVEYLPDPDPRRMRATIRVDGQVATISYAEAAAAQPPGSAPNMPTAMNGQAVMPNVPGAPQMPQVAGQPPGTTIAPGTGQPGQQPPRRIIRRRVISGAPGS
jgi:hypothetical protein